MRHQPAPLSKQTLKALRDPNDPSHPITTIIWLETHHLIQFDHYTDDGQPVYILTKKGRESL